MLMQTGQVLCHIALGRTGSPVAQWALPGDASTSRTPGGAPTVQTGYPRCAAAAWPILMDSFASIMGVIPLVLSRGAGSEMRHAMGIAVFFGRLGVIFFGLFLTPVFYGYCAAWKRASRAPNRFTTMSEVANAGRPFVS